MNNKLLSILIIIILNFHPGARGQTLSLRCSEVMLNGDVLLHWNFLTFDTTGFNNFTIYLSPLLSGPYNELTVITDFSQDTCLHVGAGANIAPVYYYMIAFKDTGPLPPSDTLATMLLNASTADFEILDLDWNPLHAPAPFLPFMHPWYLLYREYPPGNWALVDSTQDLSLTHHFWECNGSGETVRFRIDVRDNSTGCISRSNQIGEVLRNLTKPDQTIIDSVSIGPDEKVIIGWQAGLDPDIQGYIIYQGRGSNAGSGDSIGYVSGRDNTYFRYEASNPCDTLMSYFISAIDSCGNKSPLSFMGHNTLFLAGIEYDPCLMTNTLKWTQYVNFEPDLQGYRIYMSENGSTYELLATNNSGDTTFTHVNLDTNTTYSYYIRAFNQGGSKTSTSCIKEITTYNSPRPLFMYTRYATVEENERVNILFYTDTIAHVQYYRILRSTSAGGPYEEIGVVQDDGQQYLSFSDTEAEVTAESYYYQIEVVDSCGMASVIANTSRTIFLQAEALPDMTNHLSWNAYESWYGRTLGYRVYRRLDDSSPDMLADADSLTLTYTDDVSDLTGTVGRITYLVEAYEGPGNPFGFLEQSFSNEVLSEQEAKVYLPNAIMPLGLNNLLKPVIVFVGSEGYEFVVYNRWGQMVFRSNDPGEGWDGTYNGDYVPQGVYVYLLRFRNAANQPRQIKGNVAVIY